MKRLDEIKAAAEETYKECCLVRYRDTRDGLHEIQAETILRLCEALEACREYYKATPYYLLDDADLDAELSKILDTP